MQVFVHMTVWFCSKRRHLSGNCLEIPQSPDCMIVLACRFTSFHMVFMYFPLCYFMLGLSNFTYFQLCPRCHLFSLKCHMMCYSSFPSLFLVCVVSFTVHLCFPLLSVICILSFHLSCAG